MKNILRESKIHGKLTFPYIVYRGQLPEYIQSFPVHWHTEMEIMYVVNGQGSVTVQTTKYNLHAGDIILIQPETLHSIEQLDNYHMEYFNIIFDFNLLENDASYCYINFLKPIYERAKAVPVYIKDNEPLSVLITPHSEKLTVENAATLINYSTNYFSKLFHELTGTSFIKYVINYRLDIAKEMLLNTTLSVTEIAEETGFSNLPYFTRSFTAKFETTPKEYRKHKRLPTSK